MIPSRRTQPYRAGYQHPGMALTAMKRGRTHHGQNPMDAHRRAQRRRRRLKSHLANHFLGV